MSAAAGSASSEMDRPPVDRRPQLDYTAVQGDLSKVNTGNLVDSLVQSPGKKTTSDWLGEVHGLQNPEQGNSVSSPLPGSVVASQMDKQPNVGVIQPTPGQGDVDLLDLGMTEHISSELIAQIQSGKFVELHKLLPIDSADFDDQDKVVTLDETDSSIIVKTKDSRKKITTFSQWSRAWSIYHTVYIDKYPHMSKVLIKYAENIRTAAYVYSKNSDGWLLYDRHFRAKMAKDKHGIYRWDRFDYELLHSKVLLPAIKKQLSGVGTKQAYAVSGKQQKNKDIGKGQSKKKFDSPTSVRPCKFFNSEVGCKFKKACSFSHVCEICLRKHHNSAQCTAGTTKKSEKVEKSEK